MLIEILKYGWIVLSATVQVCFVGMFILGFWNGFTYEVGEKGSKFHFWFQLLPFKRFFKKRKIRHDQVIQYFQHLKATFTDLHDMYEKEEKHRERLKCSNEIITIDSVIEWVKKWKENE